MPIEEAIETNTQKMHHPANFVKRAGELGLSEAQMEEIGLQYKSQVRELNTAISSGDKARLQEIQGWFDRYYPPPEVTPAKRIKDQLINALHKIKR